MKYDLSFVSEDFKFIVDEMEKSIRLLDSDLKESVCISRRCCQILINVIGKLEEVKLENNLANDINILKFNKIINDEIYYKLYFLEGEFIKLYSLEYTISKENAEKCLDNAYEFIKLCFNSKIDDFNKENMQNKVNFTDEDLNIFDKHSEIKALLYQGKRYIEYDKEDLNYSPHNSITNARKVIEHIVIKIQNKYGIKSENNLSGNIDSIQAIMSRAEFSKMDIVRLDGNEGTHADKNGLFSNDERKAINCLNTSYDISKWYITFIKQDIKDIKPIKLDKEWKINGRPEGMYKGRVLVNKRHGYGEMYYYKKNNAYRYEGYWKDDKKHGRGILVYNNGDEYEGEFKFDKKHGKGILRYKNGDKYDGEFKLDKKNGLGKLTKSNGQEINGKWKDDELEIDFENSPKKVSKYWNKEGNYEGFIVRNKRQGQGTLKYDNGDVYQGQWDNDKKHGDGIETLTDSTVYKGKWIHGNKEGNFTIEYKNKNTYKGNYSKNIPIGDWILTDKKGSIFICKFKNGKFVKEKAIEGKTSLIKWYNEGDYEGDVKNGKRHGQGIMKYNNGSRYEGQWKCDKKEGQGKITYGSNSIYKYYEGQWKEDKKHGKGKLVHKNGKVQEGQWEDNELIKEDKKESKTNTKVKNNSIKWNDGGTYTGKVLDGKRHGQGKHIYADGSKYEGKWKCDKREDVNGKMFYKNGDVYIGNFKNNKKEGQGKYIYANGSKYEGQWKDNKMQGEGTISYKNGDEYVGQFKNNQIEGKGRMSYKDGSIYIGQWKKDKKHGKGNLIYKNGRAYEGYWKDNKMQGEGRLSYKNGDVYIGQFENDQREGQGKMIYADGSKYEGQWKKNKKHGKGKYVYKSTSDYNYYEGQWKDDQREGHGEMAYKNGEIYIGQFYNNKREGQGKIIYSDGKVFECKFENDRCISSPIEEETNDIKVEKRGIRALFSFLK